MDFDLFLQALEQPELRNFLAKEFEGCSEPVTMETVETVTLAFLRLYHLWIQRNAPCPASSESPVPPQSEPQEPEPSR